MQRHRMRRSEIQMGLFQQPVELPEWKAMPPHVKQIAMALLIELLKQAVGRIDAPQKQGGGHD